MPMGVERFGLIEWSDRGALFDSRPTTLPIASYFHRGACGRRAASFDVICCITMVLIPLLVASATLAVHPQAATIVGCASDASGDRLPRASVTVSGAGVRLDEEAGADGCFHVTGVPVGSYRVTIRLLGFNNLTRDNVVVAPGAQAEINVVMALSGICECVSDRTARSLAALFNQADAVVDIALAGPADEPAPPGSYRHVGAVREVLKMSARREGVSSLSIAQNQASGAALPYDVGQEMVAFLIDVPRSTVFRILNDDPQLARDSAAAQDDPAIVFLVRDRRIERAPRAFARYVGAPVDALLEELRAIAAAAR
jgi:hypothetical protein